MLRPPSALAWVIVPTIGAIGWALLALTDWQHRQSQEIWMQTRHQLEDQVAFHDLARRRFKVRNTELTRQVAALNSEIDEFVTAQGELAAIEERRQQVSERLLALEAKKKATEVATATLALQHEVMKSRQVTSASEDARSKATAPLPEVQSTHAFRDGLYAFAELKVSEPQRRDEGDMSIARQAVHARSEDDRTTNATVRSIKAAFKRAGAPQSLSGTDWAEAQLELGRALATKGQGSSGTRELTEAALAFRAAAREWNREKTPLEWATVQFELGRTLALLRRRSGDPSVRQESIAALGNALDVLVQVGQSSRSAEAKRLLDEMEDGSDPRQP